VNWPWNRIRGGFFHHPIIIIVVIESSVKCNLWILRTLANRLPTGFQYASIKPTKNYNKEEKSSKRKRMLQISFTNSPWRPRGDQDRCKWTGECQLAHYTQGKSIRRGWGEGFSGPTWGRYWNEEALRINRIDMLISQVPHDENVNILRCSLEIV